jgi:transcriptional regulatory protein LevR
MTIAEVVRAIESFNRVKTERLKERANQDYILAHLITRGMSITMGSKQPFPSIEEVYPTLFVKNNLEEQQKVQEQKDNLSTLRFLQFAQSYNSRFKKQEVPKKINE